MTFFLLESNGCGNYYVTNNTDGSVTWSVESDNEEVRVFPVGVTLAPKESGSLAVCTDTTTSDLLEVSGMVTLSAKGSGDSVSARSYAVVEVADSGGNTSRVLGVQMAMRSGFPSVAALGAITPSPINPANEVAGEFGRWLLAFGTLWRNLGALDQENRQFGFGNALTFWDPKTVNDWAIYRVDPENFNFWSVILPQYGSEFLPYWAMESAAAWADNLEKTPSILFETGGNVLQLRKRKASPGYDVLIVRYNPENDDPSWRSGLFGAFLGGGDSEFSFSFGRPDEYNNVRLDIARDLQDVDLVHVLCTHDPKVLSLGSGVDLASWPIVQAHPHNVFVTSLQTAHGLEATMGKLRSIDLEDSYPVPLPGFALHCAIGLEELHTVDLIGGLSRLSTVTQWNPKTTEMSLWAEVGVDTPGTIDVHLSVPGGFDSQDAHIFVVKTEGVSLTPTDFVRFDHELSSGILGGRQTSIDKTLGQEGFLGISPTSDNGDSWKEFIKLQSGEALYVSAEIIGNGMKRVSVPVEVVNYEDREFEFMAAEGSGNSVLWETEGLFEKSTQSAGLAHCVAEEEFTPTIVGSGDELRAQFSVNGVNVSVDVVDLELHSQLPWSNENWKTPKCMEGLSVHWSPQEIPLWVIQSRFHEVAVFETTKENCKGFAVVTSGQADSVSFESPEISAFLDRFPKARLVGHLHRHKFATIFPSRADYDFLAERSKVNGQKKSLIYPREGSYAYEYGLAGTDAYDLTTWGKACEDWKSDAETDSQKLEESSFNDNIVIPEWVRNSAAWWSKGELSDKEFLNSLSYLINEEIVDLGSGVNGDRAEVSFDVTQEIPAWVKTVADSWAKELTSSREFVDAIEFLIENEIIVVQDASQSGEVESIVADESPLLERDALIKEERSGDLLVRFPENGISMLGVEGGDASQFGPSLVLENVGDAPVGWDVGLFGESKFSIRIPGKLDKTLEPGETVSLPLWPGREVSSFAEGRYVGLVIVSNGETSDQVPVPVVLTVLPSLQDPVVEVETTTIDVLVVYTPAASSEAGGDDNIKEAILQSVQGVNKIFANSRVSPRLRLVEEKVFPVNYAEIDLVSDTFALWKGKIDSVQTLRAEHTPDLTMLVTTKEGEGRGFVLSDGNGPTPTPFSVVRWSDKQELTIEMAHEIGHNFGCGHQDAWTENNGRTGGIHFEGPDGRYYRTIMGAVGLQPEGSVDGGYVPYFSSPNLNWLGITLGSTEADCAGLIERRKDVVATFNSNDGEAPYAEFMDRVKSNLLIDLLDMFSSLMVGGVVNPELAIGSSAFAFPFDGIEVPDWVRNSATWWSEGKISDKEFFDSLSYLINEGIVDLGLGGSGDRTGVSFDVTQEIPEWVKIVAGSWAKELTSSQEFVDAIEFLIENKIIALQDATAVDERDFALVEGELSVAAAAWAEIQVDSIDEGLKIANTVTADVMILEEDGAGIPFVIPAEKPSGAILIRPSGETTSGQRASGGPTVEEPKLHIRFLNDSKLGILDSTYELENLVYVHLICFENSVVVPHESDLLSMLQTQTGRYSYLISRAEIEQNASKRRVDLTQSLSGRVPNPSKEMGCLSQAVYRDEVGWYGTWLIPTNVTEFKDHIFSCEWRQEYFEEVLASRMTVQETLEEVLQSKPDVVVLGENHMDGTVIPTYGALLTEIRSISPDVDCFFFEAKPEQQSQLDSYLLQGAAIEEAFPSSWMWNQRKGLLDAIKALDIKAFAVDIYSDWMNERNAAMAEGIAARMAHLPGEPPVCRKGIILNGKKHVYPLGDGVMSDYLADLGISSVRISLDGHDYHHPQIWGCDWRPEFPSSSFGTIPLAPSPSIKDTYSGNWFLHSQLWADFDARLIIAPEVMADVSQNNGAHLEDNQTDVQVVSLIPAWVKTSTVWWADGQTSDKEFLDAISFLVREGLVDLGLTAAEIHAENSLYAPNALPDWLKTTFRWWGKSQTSDADFVNTLRKLLADGVLVWGAEGETKELNSEDVGNYQGEFVEKQLVSVTAAMQPEIAEDGEVVRYNIQKSFFGAGDPEIVVAGPAPGWEDYLSPTKEAFAGSESEIKICLPNTVSTARGQVLRYQMVLHNAWSDSVSYQITTNAGWLQVPLADDVTLAAEQTQEVVVWVEAHGLGQTAQGEVAIETDWGTGTHTVTWERLDTASLPALADAGCDLVPAGSVVPFDKVVVLDSYEGFDHQWSVLNEGEPNAGSVHAENGSLRYQWKGEWLPFGGSSRPPKVVGITTTSVANNGEYIDLSGYTSLIVEAQWKLGSGPLVVEFTEASETGATPGEVWVSEPILRADKGTSKGIEEHPWVNSEVRLGGNVPGGLKPKAGRSGAQLDLDRIQSISLVVPQASSSLKTEKIGRTFDSAIFAVRSIKGVVAGPLHDGAATGDPTAAEQREPNMEALAQEALAPLRQGFFQTPSFDSPSTREAAEEDSIRYSSTTEFLNAYPELREFSEAVPEIRTAVKRFRQNNAQFVVQYGESENLAQVHFEGGPVVTLFVDGLGRDAFSVWAIALVEEAADLHNSVNMEESHLQWYVLDPCLTKETMRHAVIDMWATSEAAGKFARIQATIHLLETFSDEVPPVVEFMVDHDPLMLPTFTRWLEATRTGVEPNLIETLTEIRTIVSSDRYTYFLYWNEFFEQWWDSDGVQNVREHIDEVSCSFKEEIEEFQIGFPSPLKIEMELSPGKGDFIDPTDESAVELLFAGFSAASGAVAEQGAVAPLPRAEGPPSYASINGLLGDYPVLAAMAGFAPSLQTAFGRFRTTQATFYVRNRPDRNVVAWVELVDGKPRVSLNVGVVPLASTEIWAITLAEEAMDIHNALTDDYSKDSHVIRCTDKDKARREFVEVAARMEASGKYSKLQTAVELSLVSTVYEANIDGFLRGYESAAVVYVYDRWLAAAQFNQQAQHDPELQPRSLPSLLSVLEELYQAMTDEVLYPFYANDWRETFDVWWTEGAQTSLEVCAKDPSADLPVIQVGENEVIDETIEVVVLYTEGAKNNAGGKEAIVQQITDSIADTNTALANSQTGVRLLQKSDPIPVSYREPGVNFTSSALHKLASGQVIDFEVLHSQHAPDVVVLFIDGDAVGTELVGGGNSGMFVVVNIRSLEDRPFYELAHEIGHSLGCQHPREEPGRPGLAKPYAYGFRFPAGSPTHVTVMHTAEGMERDPFIPVLFYSNPALVDEKTGSPMGVVNEADCARAIRETAPDLAEASDRFVVASSKEELVFQVVDGQLQHEQYEIVFTNRGAVPVTAEVKMSWELEPLGQMNGTVPEGEFSYPPTIAPGEQYPVTVSFPQLFPNWNVGAHRGYVALTTGESETTVLGSGIPFVIEVSESEVVTEPPAAEVLEESSEETGGGLVDESAEQEQVQEPLDNNGQKLEQIRWAGYDWFVHDGPRQRPLSADDIRRGAHKTTEDLPRFSNEFPNVWLEDDQLLHFTMTEKKIQPGVTRWHGAQVVSQDAFGYGTYRVVIEEGFENLPKQLIAAMFVYSLKGESELNEIDIEFTRHFKFQKSTDDLVYTVHDLMMRTDEETNSRSLPFQTGSEEVSTHCFSWLPWRVEFASYVGDKPCFSSSNPPVREWLFESTLVPKPRNEHVYLNLWKGEDDVLTLRSGDTNKVVFHHFSHEQASASETRMPTISSLHDDFFNNFYHSDDWVTQNNRLTDESVTFYENGQLQTLVVPNSKAGVTGIVTRARIVRPEKGSLVYQVRVDDLSVDSRSQSKPIRGMMAVSSHAASPFFAADVLMVEFAYHKNRDALTLTVRAKEDEMRVHLEGELYTETVEGISQLDRGWHVQLQLDDTRFQVALLDAAGEPVLQGPARNHGMRADALRDGYFMLGAVHQGDGGRGRYHYGAVDIVPFDTPVGESSVSVDSTGEVSPPDDATEDTGEEALEPELLRPPEDSSSAALHLTFDSVSGWKPAHTASNGGVYHYDNQALGFEYRVPNYRSALYEFSFPIDCADCRSISYDVNMLSDFGKPGKERLIQLNFNAGEQKLDSPVGADIKSVCVNLTSGVSIRSLAIVFQGELAKYAIDNVTSSENRCGSTASIQESEHN